MIIRYARAINSLLIYPLSSILLHNIFFLAKHVVWLMYCQREGSSFLSDFALFFYILFILIYSTSPEIAYIDITVIYIFVIRWFFIDSLFLSASRIINYLRVAIVITDVMGISFKMLIRQIECLSIKQFLFHIFA